MGAPETENAVKEVRPLLTLEAPLGVGLLDPAAASYTSKGSWLRGHVETVTGKVNMAYF